MKKIALLMAALLLFFQAAAFAEDGSAVLQLIPGTDTKESAEISLAWKQEGEETLLLCSLIPDTAFTFSFPVLDYACARSQFIPEGHAEEKKKALESIFEKWLGTRLTEETAGSYAGELFDTAVTRKSYAFTTADLVLLMAESMAEVSEGEDKFTLSVPVMQSIYQWAEKHHFSVNLQCFDDQYWTCSLLKKNETVMTVSAKGNKDDHADSFLIGWQENGRIYDMLIETNPMSGRYDMRLWADPSANGWRVAQQQEPFLSLSLELTNASAQSEETDTAFRCILTPGKDSLVPLQIQGNILRREDTLRINANVAFVGRDSVLEALLTVQKEKKPIPDQQNLKRTDLERMGEQEKAEKRNQITLKLTQMTAGILRIILPALPADWVNVIIDSTL